MADCWSCGAERGEAAFCTTCGRIQPLSGRLDDFSRLGLPRTMRLDRAVLDRAFREASKLVHPDRFPRERPEERRLALAHTEKVNEAYKRLKDPRIRAEYLLSLDGVDVAEETERTEDPAFLLAMLEKQEEVEAAPDEARIADLKAETRARYDHLLKLAERYFDDGEGDRDGVRAALSELRYLRRLLDQIALREEELL